MNQQKNTAMSFRVTPRFKAMLVQAAARENRSLTNMLEYLLFDHWRRQGLDEPGSSSFKVDEANK